MRSSDQGAHPNADMSRRRLLLEQQLAERFEIKGELGTGGMSTVFLAVDKKHSRDVAIKVLRSDLMGSATGIERFAREIQLAAKLSHPNILSLHDSGSVGDLVYYVMPYVEGRSLKAHLASAGPLPIDDALDIAAQCADALAYAHQHGVVHRDVKPGNILLSQGHAFIADFGVAKALDDPGRDITATGTAVGTPAYFSPEQAAGSRNVDGRADVYALGCVLYEMIVGEPPFGGPTAQVVMARHIGESVPSMLLARPGVPRAVESVVRTALAKNPADRFPTASAFAAALRTARTSRQASVAARRGVIKVAAVIGAALLVWQAAAALRTGGALPLGPEPAIASAASPLRIAVMPFSPVGSSADLPGFAESLTGRLIDGLGSIESLTLISRRGVAPYADRRIPLDSIARALDVGTIIEGMVESAGDSVQVRVQLVDPTNGSQLATTIVTGAIPARLGLMDQVADSILRTLRQKLGLSVERRRRLIETNSLAAFEYMLRAHDRHEDLDQARRLGDRRRAEAVLRSWDSLLVEAERSDPRWLEPTVARGGLAERRVALAARQPPSERAAIYRQGLEHAERALKRHPQAPTALQLRGRLRYLLWQIERDPGLLVSAEADLRAAIDGNPDRAGVLRTLCELLIDAGRFAEALEVGERGYRLDPFLENAAVLYLRLFEAAFALGEDRRAAEWCGKGGREFPGAFLFPHCRLQLLAWSDVPPDVDSAWALSGQTLANLPLDSHPMMEADLLTDVAGVLARAGLQDSARAVLERGRAGGIQGIRDVATQAGVLFRLGDHRSGVESIRSYLAEHPDERVNIARRRELRLALELPELAAVLKVGSEVPSR